MVANAAHIIASQGAASTAPHSFTAQQAQASAAAYVSNVPDRLGLFNFVGMNFNYSEGWSYFSFLRQLGYLFDPLYSSMVARLSDMSTTEMKRSSIEEVDQNNEKSLRARNAKYRMNQIEGAVFLGAAGASTLVNNHYIHKLFDESVAAEFGTTPNNVSTLTIRQSTNPLVQSAMDYNILRSFIRLATSVPFLIPWSRQFNSAKGKQEFIFGKKAVTVPGAHRNALLTGIVTKSFDVSLERSLFRQVTAIEKLEKLVTKVQRNRLGEHDISSTTRGLIDIMQQSREEAHRELMPAAVVETLYPAFEELARGIITHRFGVNEAVFILGGRVLVWDDKELSLHNVRHLATVGLSGVAKEVDAGKKLHRRALKRGETPPRLTVIDKQRLVHADIVDADIRNYMPKEYQDMYLPDMASEHHINAFATKNNAVKPQTEIADVAAHALVKTPTHEVGGTVH